MIAEFDVAAPIKVMVGKSMGPANEARPGELIEKPFGISYARDGMATLSGKIP